MLEVHLLMAESGERRGTGYSSTISGYRGTIVDTVPLLVDKVPSLVNTVLLLVDTVALLVDTVDGKGFVVVLTLLGCVVC